MVVRMILIILSVSLGYSGLAAQGWRGAATGQTDDTGFAL